jgi:hypothetical protein
MLKSIPSSPLHAPLFIKLIDFNEKVVSDVTSETTFSLKSIYLMKREDEGCMCSTPPQITTLIQTMKYILSISNEMESIIVHSKECALFNLFNFLNAIYTKENSIIRVE